MKTAISLEPEIRRSLEMRAATIGVTLNDLGSALLDYGLEQLKAGKIQSKGKPGSPENSHALPTRGQAPSPGGGSSPGVVARFSSPHFVGMGTAMR